MGGDELKDLSPAPREKLEGEISIYGPSTGLCSLHLKPEGYELTRCLCWIAQIKSADMVNRDPHERSHTTKPAQHDADVGAFLI